MKICIDMNLPPRWVRVFTNAGWEAVHWSQVGAPTASDREIMTWARENGYVVFTHDLDFSALLTAMQGDAPSVIQVRIQNILPEAIGNLVIDSLKRCLSDLRKSAIIAIDPRYAKLGFSLYISEFISIIKGSEVVEAFLRYLRINGYPGLIIDSVPEIDNNVPNNMKIDAIAGQFAIEHTFIPRFSDQKAQEYRFIKAMAGLGSELPIPTYELWICSEYYAVEIGQDWSAILSSVKAWITREAQHLPAGEKIIDDIGIPFPLRVEKLSNGRPGIYFGRRLPDNNDSLPLRIHEHLTSKEKIEKLVPYKKDGFTTVLLIEGNLTRNKMLHAIKLAFPYGLHPDLDELWYVSTWGNHISDFTKLPKWGGNKKLRLIFVKV